MSAVDPHSWEGGLSHVDPGPAAELREPEVLHADPRRAEAAAAPRRRQHGHHRRARLRSPRWPGARGTARRLSRAGARTGRAPRPAPHGGHAASRSRGRLCAGTSPGAHSRAPAGPRRCGRAVQDGDVSPVSPGGPSPPPCLFPDPLRDDLLLRPPRAPRRQRHGLQTTPSPPPSCTPRTHVTTCRKHQGSGRVADGHGATRRPRQRRDGVPSVPGTPQPRPDHGGSRRPVSDTK